MPSTEAALALVPLIRGALHLDYRRAERGFSYRAMAVVEGGAVVATIEVPRSVAVARAEAEAGGDMTQYMELERSRIADRVEPFITAPGSRVSAVALSIAAEPEWDRVAVTQPAEPYSVQSPVRTQVEASAARERATPLGSTNAANGFP